MSCEHEGIIIDPPATDNLEVEITENGETVVNVLGYETVTITVNVGD